MGLNRYDLKGLASQIGLVAISFFAEANSVIPGSRGVQVVSSGAIQTRK